MTRRVSIAAFCFVVTILVIGGLFIVPTMQLKSGLDDMIAKLPHGETFTYGKADYSIFTHTVTLKNAALRFQPSGITVDIDSIRIRNGNTGLRKAIDAANASPEINDPAETDIAGKIVVENVHSVMSPIDFHLDRGEIDDLHVSLRQLLAPLPKIASPSGSPKTDAILQQAGLVITASRYDHLSLDNAVVIGTDEDGDKATMGIGSLTIDKFDHGDAGDTHLHGLTVAAGTVALTVDQILAGNANHRDFWAALRDGASTDTAGEKFQGASQTIDGVKLVDSGKQMAAIDQVNFSDLGYHNGALTSLKLGVKSLVLDPTTLPMAGMADLLPKLGYPTVKLDGNLAFSWNQSGQAISFDPVTIVMDQGGTLTLSAAFAGAAANTQIQSIKLAKLTARYDDASLATKWLAYEAAASGRPVQVIKDAYVAWLEKQKPAFRQDAPLSTAFAGVEAFIQNPRTLVLTLSPAAPVGLADFDAAHPQSFTGKLGLSVTTQ